jgi:hypothetical protein
MDVSQEQIGRKKNRLLWQFAHQLESWKDVPWQLYNYSIFEEVGFPFYLPASIFGIVRKKGLLTE